MIGNDTVTIAIVSGMSSRSMIELVLIASIRQQSLEKQRIGPYNPRELRVPLSDAPPDWNAGITRAVVMDAAAAARQHTMTSVASEKLRLVGGGGMYVGWRELNVCEECTTPPHVGLSESSSWWETGWL